MPNRVQWNPSYGVGNETLDNQHRKILAQCDALADCLSVPSRDDDLKFQEMLNELAILAREHFSTERALLAQCGYPSLDEYTSEQDEFDYLLAEIITMENFDKIEIQRFLALRWVGHVIDAKRFCPFVERLLPVL